MNRNDASLRFLRANGHDLAPLTGQDTRALVAIARCWELYSCSDDAGAEAALRAVASLLRCMQPKCRPLAKEMIAYAMDWADRERLWPLVSSEGAAA